MTTYTGTGSGPYGIAFDGTNMWTANYGGSSVTKITPSGTMTTYTGTGANPLAIAFDGANMWTPNQGNNSVTKITVGAYSSVTIPSSTWTYVAATINASNTYNLYINGALNQNCVTTIKPLSVCGNAANSFSGTMAYLMNSATTAPFYGNIDELRVSSTARSSGWIATEYSNQSNPSAFYTISQPNPAPTLTSIFPTSTVAGTGQLTITATGINFMSSSTIDWNGSALATTYVSSSSLSAVVSSTYVASAGTSSITIVNPTPGGGTSGSQTFTTVTGVTNISSVANQHWAWSDAIGWIDLYGTHNIFVTSTQLTGYASSSIGYISFDCGTSPSGNVCSTSNYKVTNNGGGTLSGWAWNDSIGWISLSCTNTSTCGTSNYDVYIDSSGNFHGFAWNDSIGWISFNCLDISASFCTNTSNYEVVTAWAPPGAKVGMLDSATFDTSSTSGGELNSVIWQGSLNGLPAGDVAFQFAVSNSTSGPWAFTGPDGTASTTYSGNPATPIPITNYTAYVGYRYFRYRVILTTNSTQNISPQVTGVSVDWSP